MNKKDLADKAAQAGNWIVDTTLNAVADSRQCHEDDLFNEGYDEGRDTQRKRDVESVIMAFLELKVKDQDIYKLLSKYFSIDSISEASECLFSAKKKRQIKTLREYCCKLGMTILDFREYALDHNLEEKLADDERLLDMQPEKLKAIIDKE